MSRPDCPGSCQGHICPTCHKSWRVRMRLCKAPHEKECHECAMGDTHEKGGEG
jgi:hypothetical protein